MRQDSTQIEGAQALVPTTNGAGVLSATAVGAGRGEATVSLRGLPSLRLPRVEEGTSPRACKW